jgi:uncharacterized membrane protein
MSKRWWVSAAATTLLLAGGDAAGAQESAIVVTTPYPSVAVQPGSSVEFDLDVVAPQPEPVSLSVGEVPSGWATTLRGGGFVINAVTAEPSDDDTEASLEVAVPANVEPGTYPVVVQAASPSGTTALRLQLVVQNEVDSGLAVTADFPSLRGEPASTFTYTLSITNHTPAEQTFTFVPSGPQGWEVTASPTAQEQANTVTIEAGGDAQVRVEATPPETAAQGEYPIIVEVTSATGGGGAIELTAEVTGTPRLELTTADQRLNASGEADKVKRVPMIVANSGTAELTDVKLAATAPKGWEVSFEPEQIEEVRPNETAQVVAVVKPAEGAVAGDYMITSRASAGSESANVELRYTVEGSRWLGLAGGAAIVAAVAVLGLAFWRFGRR